MADDEDLRALYAGDDDLVLRDFRHADLAGANLPGRNFHRAQMQNAVLDGSDLQASRFQQADLFRTSFQHSKLDKADFSKTGMTQVNFTGASLLGADFSQAALHSVSLKNTDLRGASFRKASIREESDFDGAVVDETTDFDGASILRSAARQNAFRFYKVELGMLVRRLPEELEPDQSEPLVNQAQIHQAAQSVLRTIDQLRASAGDLEPHAPGIGHNGPPNDEALSAEELEALAGIVLEVRDSSQNDELETVAGFAAADKIKKAAATIVKWGAAKAEVFATEFSKGLGQEAAKAKTWVGLWLVLSGQLELLVGTIIRIFG